MSECTYPKCTNKALEPSLWCREHLPEQKWACDCEDFEGTLTELHIHQMFTHARPLKVKGGVCGGRYYPNAN